MGTVWINSEPPGCFRLVPLPVVSPYKTAAVALVALKREPSPVNATVQNGNFCPGIRNRLRQRGMQLVAVECEIQLLNPSFAIVLDEIHESCDLDWTLFPCGPGRSMMAVASRLWDPIRFDGHHWFCLDFQLCLVAKLLAKGCSTLTDKIVLIIEYLSIKS